MKMKNQLIMNYNKFKIHSKNMKPINNNKLMINKNNKIIIIAALKMNTEIKIIKH